MLFLLVLSFYGNNKRGDVCIYFKETLAWCSLSWKVLECPGFSKLSWNVLDSPRFLQKPFSLSLIVLNFRIQYVLVVLTVNNSFGYDQNKLAKYFSICHLFTYWSFPLLVPLLVGWRSICCITGLIAFLHFVWSLAKEIWVNPSN